MYTCFQKDGFRAAYQLPRWLNGSVSALRQNAGDLQPDHKFYQNLSGLLKPERCFSKVTLDPNEVG